MTGGRAPPCPLLATGLVELTNRRDVESPDGGMVARVQPQGSLGGGPEPLTFGWTPLNVLHGFLAGRGVGYSGGYRVLLRV